MASHSKSLLQVRFGLKITFCLFLLTSLSQTVKSQGTQFKHSVKYPTLGQITNDQDLYHYPVQYSARWSCFNYSEISDEDFDCCNINSILCTESGPSLRDGCFATYDGIHLYIGLCNSKYRRYNSTTHNQKDLPLNLTELNQSMCGPLNRKGLLCSECADDFGISITSFGYECTNCTGDWYAVPLFLVLEFVPVTVFYLTVLTFQISVTSPPMPCFIMYAQIVLYIIDRHSAFRVLKNITKDGKLNIGMKIIETFYGLFHLDFFRYTLPPLCLSSKLKPVHIALLGYVTVIYPLFLIFLTWVCVKLHDHNVRLIVWFWRPFHKCFVRLRKRWDTKTDLIDVFITFFILSYYKFAYLAASFLKKTDVNKIDRSGNQSTINILGDLDPSMPYLGKNHLLLLTFSVLVLLIFNILPPLLLILYPTRAFRYCLSKCHLNSHTIFIFTDKIQSCYKNGLDGGRDMRSFSGFYFYLRLNFHNFLIIFHTMLKRRGWASLGITFFISALIITIARPYRKSYMYIIDALLFTNIALLCLSNANSYMAMYLLLVTPIVGMIFLIFLKIVHQKTCFQKLKTHMSICCNNLRVQVQKFVRTTKFTESQLNTLPTATQPLIHHSLPTDSEISYGTNNEVFS